jgi:tetratricopeptide (TPR) repeat protein
VKIATRALCAAGGLFLLAACKTPEPEQVYRPTETILEVLAVLRLHIDDDTYRFPPARDFTGKNVYYASLVRLERLEEIHADKLASGYLTAPLLFAKARALERMGEYSLAARHYERVTQLDGELRDPSERGLAICESLGRAVEVAPRPLDEPDRAGEIFDERVRMLEDVPAGETHYRFVVKEEVERADQARADYFSARASLDPYLDALSLQQYQRLVQRHAESKLRNRHLLDLGDQYAALSRRYVSRHPPATLGFDPATFEEYVFGATRLYEAVSQQDGAIEKIEASRKLEAYLAFSLQVEDERLPR